MPERIKNQRVRRAIKRSRLGAASTSPAEPTTSTAAYCSPSAAFLRTLPTSESTQYSLHWDIPPVDFTAWQQGLSPLQLQSARAQMRRISAKIQQTQQGQIAGHWTRQERRHGRLSALYPNDPYVKMVRDGLQFSLDRIPAQVPLPRPKLQQRDLRVMTLCVMHWCKYGMVQTISEQKWRDCCQAKRRLYYLHLFLVKKNHKQGYYSSDLTVSNVLSKWRPCLNGKPINEHMYREYYKQANSREIDAIIEQGAWFVRTDVQGAFHQLALSDEPLLAYHAPTAPGQPRHLSGLTSSQDLCCFQTDMLLDYARATGWSEAVEVLQPAQGKGMQAIVGMFGFSPMPLYWQKPYRCLCEQIQMQGAKMATVMDDNMFTQMTPVAAPPGRRSLLDDLEASVDKHIYFGCALSLKEPEALIPAQTTVFNGFYYLSPTMVKACAPAKIESLMWTLRTLVSAYKANRRVKGFFLARCTGQLADATKAMFGLRMHTSAIQANLRAIIKAPEDTELQRSMCFHQQGRVTKAAAAEAELLLDSRFANLNGQMIIHGQPTDSQITTDWSSWGWGAVMEPEPATPKPPVLSVQFPKEWRDMWSGSGETLTGGWAIMAFGNALGWRNRRVLLLMDNIFAICTYNRMGCKDSAINSEMKIFWGWSRANRITVVAGYVPGVHIVADAPSRARAGPWEFVLSNQVFSELQRLLPIPPVTFDLFATHINTKVWQYASLNPDPFATMVDCLKQPLHQHNEVWYAFPPPKVTAEFIAKVKSEGITVLLVCMAWKRVMLPMLSELIVSHPLLIPWQTNVLDPHEGRSTAELPAGSNSERQWKKWLLCGCVISGNSAQLRASRAQLRQQSLRSWLDCQPWLNSTNDGALTAKAVEWITALHGMVHSSAR